MTDFFLRWNKKFKSLIVQRSCKSFLFGNQIHNELVDVKNCDEECEFSRYSMLLQKFFDRQKKIELFKCCKIFKDVFLIYDNLFGFKDVTLSSLQKLLKK